MTIVRYTALIALALLLAACQPGTAAPAPGGITITAVEVLILESFPVQARAVVRAEAPDACWQIDSIEAVRESSDFRLAVLASHAGEVCAQVITPLEHAVALDVVGLPAGTYTVTVADVRAAFILEADNVISDQ